MNNEVERIAINAQNRNVCRCKTSGDKTRKKKMHVTVKEVAIKRAQKIMHVNEKQLAIKRAKGN